LKIDAELNAKAITAWNNYVIYTSIIESRKQAIEAAEKSLAGVKEESKMGTRTTMDVLESQQKLLSAQVAYRRALQSQVLAFYNIFNVMGNLDSIQYS
jgi:outer membrane protein